MMTYGDLVTQILIFFVLLFSISSIDAQKFQAALLSLQGALGFLTGSTTTEEPKTPDGNLDDLDARDHQQMQGVLELIEHRLQAAGLKATVSTDLEERGLVIRFMDSVLFDLGRADIKPLGRQTLDNLAPTLAEIPNQVRVEGHTDNLPIVTAAFPSNWELSTTRATNVVRYLIEGRGLDPRRMSAAGYGEWRPVAPNDTPADRQRNRRVDIVILYVSKGLLEPR
jgi:chemotaxis protein MotB